MLVPAVYDTVNTILNTARVRLNDRVDSLEALGGKLLESTQPFTQQAFNTAFRKFQEFLAHESFALFTDEAILLAFPALTNLDPAILCWMNWAQNYNGVVFGSAPVLPNNFIQPIQVWQRQSEVPQTFYEMDRQLTGMPTVPKLDFMEMWEWRDDKLFFPGCRVAIDLRVRYQAYLPDIVDDDVAKTMWYEKQVEVMRCLDPLADYVCREFCIGKGDPDGAALFQTSAEAGALKMCGRDALPEPTPAKQSERGKMKGKQ